MSSVQNLTNVNTLLDNLHGALMEMEKGKGYDKKQCKSEGDSDWHLECCFRWIMYISQNVNE